MSDLSQDHLPFSVSRISVVGAAGQGTTNKGNLELDLAVFVKGRVKAYFLLITGVQIEPWKMARLVIHLALSKRSFESKKRFLSTSSQLKPAFIYDHNFIST